MESGREQELVARPAFRLTYETPVEWVRLVERDLNALLSDHAHCELKAAASAQTLIARNAPKTALVECLAPIAIEEMEHFVLVHDELRRRGGRLEPIEPNPYAEQLLRAAKEPGAEAFLDRLLISSLIEGRSLERFWLLAQYLEDRELAGLYGDLLASEAVHQGQFLNLAREYYPREQVAARALELTEREGRIMESLGFSVRVHSGLAS